MQGLCLLYQTGISDRQAPWLPVTWTQLVVVATDLHHYSLHRDVRSRDDHFLESTPFQVRKAVVFQKQHFLAFESVFFFS